MRKIMHDIEFAKKGINLLCNYFGEMTIFEVFVQRWGVYEIYDVLSELITGDSVEEETSKEGNGVHRQLDTTNE